MIQKEFGKLIKVLRMDSIRGYGEKYSREEFSKNIQISSQQLERLEKGDFTYINTQTLRLIAGALNLTELEEREFLYAAVSPFENKAGYRDNSEEQLQKLLLILEKLTFPAYIIDPYANLVAANAPALQLYNVTDEVIEFARSMPLGLNIIQTLYSSRLDFKSLIGYPSWREAANLYMLFFRRSTLSLRHTAYFNNLIELLLEEEQFNMDWYSSHMDSSLRDKPYQHVNYTHPVYGPLLYLGTETVVNTDRGNLYLLTFNPSDIQTLRVFSELLGTEKNKAFRLAPWPDEHH